MTAISHRQPVFPFFVGCPRSGTTLVRAMFDSHPALAVPGESHFIVRMARECGGYARDDGFAASAFVADLLADERFALWQLSEAAVRDALTETAPSGLADALRAVYASYAAHRDKPSYADKTPGYVRNIPLLADLFPEARFVHVLRDGRDVALSLMDVDWASRQGDFEAITAFWKTNVEAACKAGEQLGRARYRELRYERLVADPETVLRDTCAFLQLPYERAMLTYHERAGELAATLRAPDDHRHLTHPPVSGLRDWRTQMSPQHLARFEAIAGDTLERMDYPRAT